MSHYHQRPGDAAPVVVLGNGKSRLTCSYLPGLHAKYFTVGCNAIYRDFAPDILVATDVHITAEIVHSGYTKKNKCYFRDWICHPAEYKDLLTSAFDRVTDLHKGEPRIVVTGLTDVLSDITAVSSEVVVFGVDDDDISSDLKDVGCDLASKETMEFAGPNALDVATKAFDHSNEFYLFGFDFDYAGQANINNVYAGTPNYRYAHMKENEKMNQSAYELRRVFDENMGCRFCFASDYQMPLIWRDLPNVYRITVGEFLGRVFHAPAFR